MEREWHKLETAAQAAALEEAAYSIWEGWYQDRNVDWDAFYYRLAEWTGWELLEFDSPADRKMHRMISKFRNS